MRLFPWHEFSLEKKRGKKKCQVLAYLLRYPLRCAKYLALFPLRKKKGGRKKSAKYWLVSRLEMY